MANLRLESMPAPILSREPAEHARVVGSYRAHKVPRNRVQLRTATSTDLDEKA
jgi:hypothetical protein